MSGTFLGSLRAAREWATPTLKTSAFLEKGVLTPEEFVHAGDELVFRCPTWSWEGGDPVKTKPYLPPEKQYLVTRNVPCQVRVSSLEQNMEMQGDEDEWLVSTIVQNKDIGEDFDMLDQDGELMQTTKEEAATSSSSIPQNTEGEEYVDMADFEDDNVLADEATCTASQHNQDNIIKVRTYDLSITYDKYYQTPRVWMVGKNADGQPLSGKEMMEDVTSDYANRTVTIEAHPHVAGPHASIHPCQHGKVMKTIIHNLMAASNATDGDKKAQAPSVEMYFFIFLKFVSSMIPTINYDFTMDVTASTKK